MQDLTPKLLTPKLLPQEDDPLGHAMRGLIDNASIHEEQLTLLWQAIEKLSTSQLRANCVLGNAALQKKFDGKKLNDLTST